MSFADDMKRFLFKLRGRERMLYKRSVEHAYRSIRFGSPVTGAPGQPVDKGELLASWELIILGPRTAEMKSDAPHADPIEHNRRGAKLRSSVGGFHSVMRTRLGWSNIVRYELAKMGWQNPGGTNGVPSSLPEINFKQPRDARGRFASRKAAQLKIHAGG